MNFFAEEDMIPIGYMAKNIMAKPDWLKVDNVDDIYSVSGCMSNMFTDYIDYWKHNGYWMFNEPDIIIQIAKENKIDTSNIKFFFYEIYEKQYSDEYNAWEEFKPEESFATKVKQPINKKCLGYDITSFSAQTMPECSPLSCNGLAQEINVNEHCLLSSLEDAIQLLELGKFTNCEPGPYRILAVYEFS